VHKASPRSPALLGDDATGEDGIDDQAPELNGIRCANFTLAAGECPTGAAEAGFQGTQDDADDANGHLAIDFGFVPRLGLGNLVFLDNNTDGKYAAGTDAPLANVPVEAVFVFGGNEFVIATTQTDASGLFRLWVAPSRTYYLRIAASQFASGGPLSLLSPTSLIASGKDDNSNQNALATANPAYTGVSTAAAVYYLGAQPTDANGEVGVAGSADNAEDSNVNLTLDFGLKAKGPGIGNLVFKDLNGNGWFEEGTDEPLAGVVVQLFPVGSNPASASPSDTAITATNGTYLLMAPAAGNYYVHIPAAEFQAGGHLSGFVPASNPATGNVKDDSGGPSAPNGDHNAFGSNAETNGISSLVVGLAYTGMPTNGTQETGFAKTMDDLIDAAVNLTMDFGFVQTGAPLAGRVRNDLNGNGNPADPDPALAGVVVTLYPDVNGNGVIDVEDAPALASDSTDSGGNYLFPFVADGTYIVEQSVAPGGDATWDTDGGDYTCTCVVMNSTPCPGVDFLQCFAPSGSFYDSATAQIIPGGHVNISGPGTITVMMDGETGQYCYSSDTDGVYTLTLTPPAGYLIDTARPAVSTAFESTSATGTVSIGAGEDAANPGFLASAAAEANPWHTQLHLVPGMAVPVNNNIPLMPAAINTFTQWQTRNALGGANAAADDADGDGLANVLEYALGLKADSGVAGAGLFHLEKQVDGSVDAVFVRPISGHTDVSYRLEAINDLATSPQSWEALAFAPAVQQSNATGLETVRYAGVDGAALFAGLNEGFLRLRVSLDSDHNGTAEATAVTPVHAWTRREFETGQQTFSMSLLNQEVFAGAVAAVDGNALTFTTGGDDIAAQFQPGTSYFLEVVSGSRAGHRFDVSVGASTETAVALDLSSARNTMASVPADLVGARVVVRPHWTSATVLPTDLFKSTNSPARSDRMMFFNTASNSYSTFWLYAGNGGALWAREGDASLTSHNQRVFAPGEGVLVHVRGAAVTAVHIGQVRSNRFILPLSAGTQLIGGGYPMAQSPEDRGMNAAGSFTAGQEPASADRLRLWVGDVTVGTTGYDSFFLKLNGANAQWVREGDANPSDQSQSKLFTPNRAAFVVRHDAAPDYSVPAPWAP
jgi:hypothetical protein